MSKVLRHNVFITTAVTAAATFNSTIYCPFVPDEVKVKQIAYSSINVDHAVYSLQCRALVGASAVLGSFVDPCVSFTGTTFPLSGFMNGTYTFSVYEITTLATTTPRGDLNIMLEFRKYL
jgi:hypothetical protein